VAGGPIVETFGWRWIFVAQVPLTLAGLLLALLVLPETERRERVAFDVKGAVALAVGATSLLFAINRGPLWGWSDPMIVSGFVLAPIAVVVFVLIERRVAHPLLPLAYVRRRNFSFAIATQTFTNFAYMGGFVITPIFLESVFDYPETRVGGLMIARPLAFAIAGPIAADDDPARCGRRHPGDADGVRGAAGVVRGGRRLRRGLPGGWWRGGPRAGVRPVRPIVTGALVHDSEPALA
jgi:MFS family permease